MYASRAVSGVGRNTLTAVCVALPVNLPIADVAPTHLSYPAVSVSVASCVMGLEGGAFGLLEPVTGAQAVDVINRLEALAR